MVQTAFLDIRVLPWRPRARVMKPETLRDGVSNTDPFLGGDDLSGLVLGLGMWLFILIAAPLVVLVLAAGLLSIELPLVILLGALLVIVRFLGVIPWTVVTVDNVTGEEAYTSFRNIFRAIQCVRRTNHDRRTRVRSAWS
jgi:hypothetical protein